LSKEATLARLLWMDDLVAAVGRGEMPTSAIGAGYVISGKVNSKSGVAWAKQKIMAKMIGIKEDSFQRLVRVLHDHGFLGITVKWADGKKHNHYVLTRPAADERYLNPGIPATDPDLNPGRYPDLNPDNLSKVDLSNQSSSSVGANPAAAIDDDGLLSKLTEAAGGHIAAGCANVRPIRALMATGVDLDLDVLPFIRENVTKLREPLKTWNAHWLKPGLLDFARSRKASPKPLGNAYRRTTRAALSPGVRLSGVIVLRCIAISTAAGIRPRGSARKTWSKVGISSTRSQIASSIPRLPSEQSLRPINSDKTDLPTANATVRVAPIFADTSGTGKLARTYVCCDGRGVARISNSIPLCGV
jgi:hypothetical protein